MSGLMLLIKESWRGQRPLWKVFWLYYVLGVFPVTALGFVGFYVADYTPRMVGLTLVLGWLLLLVLWKVWALVSIWRCAPNSLVGWKILARGYVVVFASASL